VHLDSGARITYSLPGERDDDIFGIVGLPVRPDQDRISIASYGDAEIYCDPTGGAVRIGDSGQLVNSSVELFAEFSLRWHLLASILADEQNWAGARDMEIFRATGSVEAGDGPYADYLAGRGLVVDYFTSIDPAAMSDEGWWPDIVVEYS
jgi:hypothetical protein